MATKNKPGRKIVIVEGKTVKGGVLKPPKTPRPKGPPAAMNQGPIQKTPKGKNNQ